MRALLVGFMLLLALGGARELAAAPPPNIIFIVSDDQGYRDLGVLNPELKTPHLDRLVHQGVRLTQFYVTWPACTPSRASLLTGRYPQRNGLYDMIRNEAPDYGHRYTPEEYAVTFERIGGLDVREVLLPQLLRQAGYRCAVFGKWDLGQLHRYLPLQRGFDQFYGFVNTGIDYFTHERYGVPSMYRNNRPTTEDRGTYSTELFCRETLRFIRQNRHRPFFIYLAFNAPHSASNLDPRIRPAPQAPERYKRLYPRYREEYARNPRHRYAPGALVPTRSTRRLRYLASISAMDEAIGRVLDLLDELQLTRRTFVFFFSDNGGSHIADNSPLRGYKGQVFEGGVRVCAVARWPGHLPQGKVCSEFLTSLELFPTALALAGVEPPQGLVLDGFDMLPVLQGRRESPRQEMFWQRRNRCAARVGHWKWVRNAQGTFLFDLSRDPGEQHNLAKTQPRKAAQLQARFEAWQKQMQAAEPRGPFRDY